MPDGGGCGDTFVVEGPTPRTHHAFYNTPTRALGPQLMMEMMMGNHNVGQAFAAAADMFWDMVPSDSTPIKAVTLNALEKVGERYRGADAEFDDELMDHTTPLGRMVAIAFDATPEETSGTAEDNLWFYGPYMRFRTHFGFC